MHPHHYHTQEKWNLRKPNLPFHKLFSNYLLPPSQAERNSVQPLEMALNLHAHENHLGNFKTWDAWVPAPVTLVHLVPPKIWKPGTTDS